MCVCVCVIKYVSSCLLILSFIRSNISMFFGFCMEGILEGTVFFLSISAAIFEVDLV